MSFTLCKTCKIIIIKRNGIKKPDWWYHKVKRKFIIPDKQINTKLNFWLLVLNDAAIRASIEYKNPTLSKSVSALPIEVLNSKAGDNEAPKPATIPSKLKPTAKKSEKIKTEVKKAEIGIKRFDAKR